MNLYEQLQEEEKIAGTSITLEGDEDENDGADDTGKPEQPAEGEKVETAEETDSASGADAGKDPAGEDEKPKDEVIAPDAAAFAKQRREMREMKAKLAALEAAKSAVPEAKTEAKAEPAPVADPEPNKNEDYQGWLEWSLRQGARDLAALKAENAETKNLVAEVKKKSDTSDLMTAAYQELSDIEDTYKADNADYDNAMSHAQKRFTESLKILNPNLTKKQIEDATRDEVLKVASLAMQQGQNPAEVLYDMAIERFGYVKEQPKEAPKEAEKVKPKLDLAKIEANKKKSATSLGNGGQGGSVPLTKEVAANSMTLAEFSRLTESQLDALEA